MAVSDRWHKTHPAAGRLPLRGLASTADHGVGKRWQVRWRDDTDRQRKANFERKLEAQRLERSIRTQARHRAVRRPECGQATFQAYAEQWQAALTCDPHTKTQIESRLRVNAYPVLGPWRWRRWRSARRCSSTGSRGESPRLAASTSRNVCEIASMLFAAAAADDQVIARIRWRHGR